MPHIFRGWTCRMSGSRQARYVNVRYIYILPIRVSMEKKDERLFRHLRTIFQP